MVFNKIGNMAHQYWQEIPNHFPYIELGNFVVMPNHIHGILIINKNMDNWDDGTLRDDILGTFDYTCFFSFCFSHICVLERLR